MGARRYATPEAFKSALEQRLLAAAHGNGARVVRQRQLIVFERFLARIFAHFSNAVILKGGLVLELRLSQARSTRDIDVRMTGSGSTLLTDLQSAARQPIDDFFTFEVMTDAKHPRIAGDGIRYEGRRFRVEAALAGKIYGQHFGFDVAFGGPIFGEPETIRTPDSLAFAGIAPPAVQIYPIETHLAEKLHAYTMPRDRTNSRIKDLPDINLLGLIKPLNSMDLRSSMEQVFAFRNTHPLPLKLPSAPISWERPYETLAQDNLLPWATLSTCFLRAAEFLDPVLTHAEKIMWQPSAWRWTCT